MSDTDNKIPVGSTAAQADTQSAEAYIPPAPTMRPWALNLLSLVLGLIVGMIPGVISIALFGKDFRTVDSLYVFLPLAMLLFTRILNSGASRLFVIPAALFSYIGMALEILLLNQFHHIFLSVWSGIAAEAVYAHLFILVGLAVCWELLPKPVRRVKSPEPEDEDDELDEEDDEDGEYEYYYEDDAGEDNGEDENVKK